MHKLFIAKKQNVIRVGQCGALWELLQLFCCGCHKQQLLYSIVLKCVCQLAS